MPRKQDIKEFLNYLIILFAFVIPFHPSVGRKLIVVIFVLWLFSVDYKRFFYYLLNDKFLRILTLFALFLTLSVLWSENKADSFSYMKTFYIYMFLPILIFASSVEKKYIKFIVSSFLLSMFINEMISYGIVFELWDTAVGSPYDPVPFQTSHLTYSLFVAFTVLLTLYSFVHENNKILKVIFFIFLITMSINLFMSAGRTGQYSLFLTVPILLLIYFRKYFKIMLMSFLVFLLVFFVAYSIGNTFKTRTNQFISDIQNVIKKNAFSSSFGTRLAAYYILPLIIKESNFFVGVGIGDKQDVVKNISKHKLKHNVPIYKNHGAIHNLYIEIFLSNGIIGLFLMLLMLYYLLFCEIKDRQINFIKYSFMLLFLFSAFVGDNFHLKEIMFLFALFSGIIIVQHEYEQQSSQENNTNL